MTRKERVAMFSLSRWPYIQTVALSGDMQIDATNLLTINGKSNTVIHSIAVANTSKTLAARFGLDETKAMTSALLHDIAAIIKPKDMLDFAVDQQWQIDTAECKYPFLLHQRLSSVIAIELFHVYDTAITSAIACHSTLTPDPSDYDMVLFLADKLSWDQDGLPPYYGMISSALNQSLCFASLTYIDFVLKNNMILYPHQWLIRAKRWLEEHI